MALLIPAAAGWCLPDDAGPHRKFHQLINVADAATNDRFRCTFPGTQNLYRENVGAADFGSKCCDCVPACVINPTIFEPRLPVTKISSSRAHIRCRKHQAEKLVPKSRLLRIKMAEGDYLLAHHHQALAVTTEDQAVGTTPAIERRMMNELAVRNIAIHRDGRYRPSPVPRR